MEKEPVKSLEQLVAEKEEVARKIIDLDAKGDKGEEWNALHNRHEELTQMIESVHNPDEMDQAA